MIHPHTEVQIINEAIGYGVFATKFIPEGTITYIKDGIESEITPEHFVKLPPILQEKVEKYCYMDDKGVRIVSWDNAKYVNHCCDSNTISTGYGFEIAIKDIHPGEELTDEYGLFNMKSGFEVICNKLGCRKIIQPSDLEEFYKQWDAKIIKSFTFFYKVEQPLLPIIEKKVKKELEEYFQNPKKYKSVYFLKCDRFKNVM
ncbi:MAG: SET domain-containing protein [Chitinophagaceae bacterium]|nr:SET domain-containing protein [Chitinophagaceae bacterium]